MQLIHSYFNYFLIKVSVTIIKITAFQLNVKFKWNPIFLASFNPKKAKINEQSQVLFTIFRNLIEKNILDRLVS